MIRITQIEGESAQGKTEPLFCVGEDGNRYVVKGRHAGNLARICEWLAGRLGQKLNLPIPRFSQMELDPQLLNYDATGFASKIGKGIAFGSLRIANVNEFQLSQSQRVAPELRARILLFDWWIANSDRLLTESGGNPNLLWNVDLGELVVIDHNLAFDLTSCHDFWELHVFKDDLILWTSEFRFEQSKLMSTAMKELDVFWSELPEEWTDASCGLTLKAVSDLLWRFDRDSDKFWCQS